MILSDRAIKLLIETDNLIDNIQDLNTQLQPNGFDLTVANVQVFRNAGELTEHGKELPRTIDVPLNDGRMWYLRKGAYFITFNEIVSLPENVMAFGRPRSTLLRSGVAIHTAVWDAGYCGQSSSLLEVYNDDGFHLGRNARVLQLVFSTLDTAVAQGYSGSYQFEGLSKRV